MVSTGNASGAGLPAANEITPGMLVNFRISRIAEGCNASTFSANLYCMGTFFLSGSVAVSACCTGFWSHSRLLLDNAAFDGITSLL